MTLVRLARSWLPAHHATAESARPAHTLAVLSGARSLVQRGWLQGAWYVLEAPDGRRRVAGSRGSLILRSSETVAQACLVGAVVEATRWHGSDRGAAGPAIDALWRSLREREGASRVGDRRSASGAARWMRVRELARWNDRRGRTPEEVTRLLEVTIGRLQAEDATSGVEERQAAPGDADSSATRSASLGRSSPESRPLLLTSVRPEDLRRSPG